MTWEIDLSHEFHGTKLAISFQTGPGVTAIFGPSGAGKTSLARAVAGLWRPQRLVARLGETILADTPAGRWVPPEARGLGMAFQDARLFPHLGVAANITYGTRRGHDPDLYDTLLETLDLRPLLARAPKDLSGGEAQRVSLARALLPKPKALILDEPLSALDLPRRTEILSMLETLRDQTGTPMLYISHAVEEVARLADALVILSEGQVVASGPVQDLLSDITLASYFGANAIGSVISAQTTGEVADGLARVTTPAGSLFVTGLKSGPGQTVRIRVPANDVILATEPLTSVSALNQLPATIVEIGPEEGGIRLIKLDLGGELLLARITARSTERLGLRPGYSLTAILKSVTVSPAAIARRR